MAKEKGPVCGCHAPARGARPADGDETVWDAAAGWSQGGQSGRSGRRSRISDIGWYEKDPHDRITASGRIIPQPVIVAYDLVIFAGDL